MSAATTATGWGLVGDIGATNARFALVDPGGNLQQTRGLLCDDYPTIADAIAEYLEVIGRPRPRKAVLAVAATPAGDEVSLTNHPWTFSIGKLKPDARHAPPPRRSTTSTPMPLAVPHLDADSTACRSAAATPVAGGPIGVIGPGTGLGVAC